MNIYDVITERIIEEIEKNNILPYSASSLDQKAVVYIVNTTS